MNLKKIKEEYCKTAKSAKTLVRSAVQKYNEKNDKISLKGLIERHKKKNLFGHFFVKWFHFYEIL